MSVDPAKLRALREALERGHVVTFKNGSVVRQNKNSVVVERPTFGSHMVIYQAPNLDRAYVLALDGPPPRSDLSLQNRRRRRRKPQRDWGEVPF